MVNDAMIDQILTQFCDYIRNETGISLSAGNLELRQLDARLELSSQGSTIATITFDPEPEDLEPPSLAADLAIQLIEAIDHLKPTLIQLKIDELEQYLPAMIQELKRRGTELGIPSEILDALRYEIEDLGYDYKHYMAEQEAEWGYPIIAMTVSCYPVVDVSYPLNIYYPEDAVEDWVELVELVHDAVVIPAEGSRKGVLAVVPMVEEWLEELEFALIRYDEPVGGEKTMAKEQFEEWVREMTNTIEMDDEVDVEFGPGFTAVIRVRI